MNDRVYIHEFIDIIGPNRAKYMYHMTANFSPIAQDERDQRCYGVWGVVGSTKRWPEVVNLWEEKGFDGQARSFRHEFNHPTLQDPKLAKWWAEAAKLRSSGTDRLLVPAPWTRTIEELCADGVTGEVYAHEQIQVPPGRSAEYLEIARDEAAPVYGKFGWELAGAWETAMVNDSECFLLWAIPSWEHWAEFEKARRTDDAATKWNTRNNELTTYFQRFLMVDSELCPFRTGRQPSRDDRIEVWDE
jgi:hypothetical protein